LKLEEFIKTLNRIEEDFEISVEFTIKKTTEGMEIQSNKIYANTKSETGLTKSTTE